MKKHLFIFLFMTILLLVASSVRAQSGLCKALHDEITADLKIASSLFGKIQRGPFRRFLRFIGT